LQYCRLCLRGSVTLLALFLYGSTAVGELLLDGHDSQPNVLWLVGEDMGLDLSCYGMKGIQTPNLDRLAREGIRFDNAFCASPLCSPSRSAFNTGMYATTIGAQDHRTPASRKKPLPIGVKTISQWFADAGYHTCLMGNPKLDFNFLPDGEVFQSQDWSNRAPGQRFFALFNFVEPHRWGWDSWQDLPTHLDPSKVDLPPVYPDEPVMRASFAKYLDYVVELDRKIGVVLRRLEEEELLENTVVVFFGDNGRTMYRGKQWLYDEGLRVPLIIRYPAKLKPGTVNQALVNLIDLAPTSLSMAEIPVPLKMQGRVFLGDRARSRQYIFASRDFCGDVMDCMRCVRDERYKYIRNYFPENGYKVAAYTKQTHPEWQLARDLYDQGRLTPAQALMFVDSKAKEELYELTSDPCETVNLAESAENSSVLSRLQNALDGWIAENGDQPRTRLSSE